MTCNARQHFLNPLNVGSVDSPEAVGRAGSLKCGAVLVVSLRIGDHQTVRDAKFKVAGCSRLIAACSILTEHAKGKTTAQAAKLAETAVETLESQLGPAPEGRDHCGIVAGEALLHAIRNYSDSIRAEWSGDDALICTCFGVSEKTIEAAIRKGNLQTVAEVTIANNAGAGCRSCHPLIQDILDEVQL
jgi:NifU-like protein